MITYIKARKNFICVCPKGYIGDLCEIQTKCINCKGTCGTDYKCNRCKLGWTGDYCQTPRCIDLKMCKNGGNYSDYWGICSYNNTKNIFQCNCVKDTSGDYCETDSRKGSNNF